MRNILLIISCIFLLGILYAHTWEEAADHWVVPPLFVFTALFNVKKFWRFPKIVTWILSNT